jgi:hypothetical protein
MSAVFGVGISLSIFCLVRAFTNYEHGDAFNNLVDKHNKAVDYIDKLYYRIKELEDKIKELRKNNN